MLQPADWDEATTERVVEGIVIGVAVAVCAKLADVAITWWSERLQRDKEDN